MSEIKKELTLIPKSEKYIQYMLEIIMKLPRTEKFSIDSEKINYINMIDAQLNVQRILLRIMYKNKWIDEKKFNYVIELIYELGKIIGGLLKYYGKNNKKSVW